MTERTEQDAAPVAPPPDEAEAASPPAQSTAEAERDIRCTLCGLRACWT